MIKHRLMNKLFKEKNNQRWETPAKDTNLKIYIFVRWKSIKNQRQS